MQQMSKAAKQRNTKIPAEEFLSREPVDRVLEVDDTLYRLLIEDTKIPSFNGLSIEESVLRTCTAYSENLTGGKISDSILKGCDFSMVEMKRGSITRASVSETRLTGFRLTDGWLIHSELSGIKGDYSQFWGSTIKNVVFDGCDLTESTFEGAKLENVLFRNCELTGASFLDAETKNVQLGDSRIGGLRVEPKQLKGMKVNVYQAASILQNLTGVTVEE